MTWSWDPTSTARLGGFLRDRGLVDDEIRLSPIGDGRSNLTYLVNSGDTQLVVRRPPPPPLPPGGHDVAREARLLQALADTEVPTPLVLAIAQANEVLDVPLYVMEHVPGFVITDRTPEILANPASRRALSVSLIDTLASVHTVDIAHHGLTSFGRSEGFNSRQVRRIAGMAQNSEGQLPEGFVALHDWLIHHAPQESAISLVHLDFRLGNVLVSEDDGGKIRAVLDWELATLGDPLLDLAVFLTSVPDSNQLITATQTMGIAQIEEGFLSPAAYLDRYSLISGREIPDLRWYFVCAYTKLAAMYEYGRRRAAERGGDPYFLEANFVAEFLDKAQTASF